MIEKDTIVELSNDKKYLITDLFKEEDKTYYLGLELDSDTEEPIDNSEFFESDENDTLSIVDDESDISYLKIEFADRFAKLISESEELF